MDIIEGIRVLKKYKQKGLWNRELGLMIEIEESKRGGEERKELVKTYIGSLEGGSDEIEHYVKDYELVNLKYKKYGITIGGKRTVINILEEGIQLGEKSYPKEEYSLEKDLIEYIKSGEQYRAVGYIRDSEGKYKGDINLYDVTNEEVEDIGNKLGVKGLKYVYKESDL